MHPLDEQRFEALSLDYITQLGQEMFCESPLAHRDNSERARRLCYLIQLKAPRINAAQFFASNASGRPEEVEVALKTLNEMVLGMMYQEQMSGQLSSQKVDGAVWHRMAA